MVCAPRPPWSEARRPSTRSRLSLRRSSPKRVRLGRAGVERTLTPIIPMCRGATTVVPVTGPQYDPVEMDYRMPNPGRSDVTTAWPTRAGTSDGCRHRGHGLATPARAADDDLQIKELAKQLGKKSDDGQREAHTSMQSAPCDRPERGRVAVTTVAATGTEMTTVCSTGEGQIARMHRKHDDLIR